MTNKKFKVAAMSMALTACVAAQPLIANAVEPGDANEPASTANESAAPSEEPAAVTESTPSAAAAAPESQHTSEPESTNDSTSEKSSQETVKTEEAFGDDVDVKYNHDNPQTDEKTGSTTLTGEVVKKDETGDQGKTDGGQKTGETVDETKPDEVVPPTDGSNLDKDEDKKSEFGGNATKTETPDGAPEVSAPVAKPGAEPRPDPDPDKKPTTAVGSDGTITITTPTLTDGTQTTTTTGFGHAKADTEEKTPESTEIDLNEELGKNADIKWSDAETAEKGTPVGDNGYKIDSVKTDGNKQTLTLVKEDPPKEGRMTSDDVAKLVDLADAEKTDNGDGSYTLKRTEEIQDKDGKTITRTTYITVNEKDSHVSIKSSTTLVVSREKEEHHEGDTVDVSNNFKLPDISLNNKSTGEKGDTINSEKLGSLIEESRKNGTYTTSTNENGTQTTIYTVKEGNREYTITVDKAAAELSAEEIVEKLGKDYKVETDENGKSIIYYVGNGQHAALTVGQTKDLREHLSYTVDVKETNRDTKTTVEGKDTAEAAAKDEAVRNALKAAVKEMLDKGSITENEAKELNKQITTGAFNAKAGGTFKTDITVDGVKKHFELDYSKGTITTTPTPNKGKDDDKTTDNTDHTVNGKAYVFSGKVVQENGGTAKEENSTIFTFDESGKVKAPDAANGTETYDGEGRLKSYTIGNTTYEFEYGTMNSEEAQKALSGKLNKDDWDLGNFKADITTVSWTAKTTKVDTGSAADIYDGTGCTIKQDEETEGKFNISFKDGTSYNGFTKTGDNTYTGKSSDGKKDVTITVKDGSELGNDDIEKLIRQQYKDIPADGSITITGNTATYTGTDGNTHTVSIRSAKNQTVLVQTVEALSPIYAQPQKTEQAVIDNICSQLQGKLDALTVGQTLQVTGKDGKVATIKKTSSGYTLSESDKTEIQNVANVQELAKKIVAGYASNQINYDSLTSQEIWELLDVQQQYADGTNNAYTKGQGCDSYWAASGYENNGTTNADGTHNGEVPQYGTTTFDSLGLDANVTIEDAETGKKIDGVLLNDAKHSLTFTYGTKEQIAGYVDLSKYPDYDYNGTAYYGEGGTIGGTKAEHHPTTGAKTADFTGTVAESKKGDYWNGTSYDQKDKLAYTVNGGSLTGKNFYKVIGSVAYDKQGNDYTDKTAADAALEKLKADNKDGKYDSGVVVTYMDNGVEKYRVYGKVTNLKAYGYMTASANTSTNQNRTRYYSTWTPGNGAYWGQEEAGTYELRIQGLKKYGDTVTGQYGVGKSLDLSVITEKKGSAKHLGVDQTSTTSKTNEGSGYYGSYTNTWTKSENWRNSDGTTSTVDGTGDGLYTSFVKLIDRFFHGKSDELTKDNGSFTYSYDYTTVSDLDVESVTRTVKKHAQVDYRYTIEDVRDVEIPGKDIVHIDPDGGGDDGDNGIIEENTPDSPVLPGNPELPPVQDARPDAPVLPSDPVLPPVQDARIDAALPQTGVNWLTAIGLALSGMTLMITGAFASLTGKNAKH